MRWNVGAPCGLLRCNLARCARAGSWVSIRTHLLSLPVSCRLPFNADVETHLPHALAWFQFYYHLTMIYLFTFKVAARGFWL